MPRLTRNKIVKTVNKDTLKESRKRNSSNITENSEEHKQKRSKNHSSSKQNNLLSLTQDEISKVNNSTKRLKDEFFDIPCIELTKRLLGKVLVRKLEDGTLLKGRIVETECYAGGEDKASCSFGGKITPKNKPTFMKPGTAFVYMTYGMYHCINISSQGEGSAVLLRALEPIDGINIITKNRQSFGNKKDSNKLKTFKYTELCNGPSKLCIGFNIDKSSVNERDLCTWEDMWLENDSNDSSDINDNHIVKSKRIGIDAVGEPWASKPLRYYIYESILFVSKRDKKSEMLVEQNILKNDEPRT